MTIPVIHMFDNRYALPAAVAFKSLLDKACRDYEYRIIVLENDVTEENKRRLGEVVGRYPNATLEFVSPKNDYDTVFQGVRNKAHFSKEIIYKLSIPDLFPDLHYAIISDVDCIYLDDISLVYCEFVEKGKGNLLGGITSARRPLRKMEAFNSGYEKDFSEAEQRALQWGVGAGFMVYDLDEMRKFGFAEKAMRYFAENAHRLIQPEQDVINLVGEGRIHYFSERAMVTIAFYVLSDDDEKARMREALEHPIQLHYSSATKPWNFPVSPKAHLWWEICAQTPFFYEAIGRLLPKGFKEISRWSLFGLPLITVRADGDVKCVKLAGLELGRIPTHPEEAECK